VAANLWQAIVMGNKDAHRREVKKKKKEKPKPPVVSAYTPRAVLPPPKG
jgi:hypothetical protein